MKIVKVIYTAKAEYSEQNQRNIKNVMKDLGKLGHPGIFYHVCLGADEKTFTHTAFFESDEIEKVLFNLSSFQTFQEQLKVSVPEVPPKSEKLTLVGSSNPIFNL
jgi:hypothetical protein